MVGCAPRSGSAPRPRDLEHSTLWRPTLIATAVALVAGACSYQDSGLLSKLGMALAVACWFSAGAACVLAGFQDLGWNIPKGAKMRPDRMGTLAVMAVGLAMVLVGLGCAIRIVEPVGWATSAMLCAGASGCLLVGLAMAILGALFDPRRVRALTVFVPLIVVGAIVGLEFFVGNPYLRPAKLRGPRQPVGF